MGLRCRLLRNIFAVAMALFGVVALPACDSSVRTFNSQPATTQSLLEILGSTTTPDESRQAADRKYVGATSATDGGRMNILEQLVWAPGQSDAMRIYALDEIALADAARAGRVLMYHLYQIDEWPVLGHACELAVRLGDVRVADALVRSLARPAKTFGRRERPEARALAALSNKTLDEALIGRLLESQQGNVRVAALDVLVEIQGAGPVKTLIGRAEVSKYDRWWRDLQWWVGTFDSLPSGEQDMVSLRELAKPGHAELVRAAKASHEVLKGEGDYVVGPRFVYLLGHVEGAMLHRTREELAGDIGGRLGALEHVARQAAYRHSPEDKDESLGANLEKLSRCDLMAILLLLQGLEDGGFRGEVLRLGLEDMSDTTTEHGGLITLGAASAAGVGKVVANLYPPLYTGNDLTYVASDKLLADAPLALVNFHFHFQKVDNSANAGPGAGDLAYVQRMQYNAVVFTSVGKGRFDVDYYAPSGAVVDLGIYQAP